MYESYLTKEIYTLFSKFSIIDDIYIYKNNRILNLSTSMKFKKSWNIIYEVDPEKK